MEQLSSFWAMGGYAGFVWPSYLLTALVMIGFVATTFKSLRARQRRLAQLEGTTPRRRRRGAKPDPV